MKLSEWAAQPQFAQATAVKDARRGQVDYANRAVMVAALAAVGPAWAGWGPGQTKGWDAEAAAPENPIHATLGIAQPGLARDVYNEKGSDA